MGRVQRFLSVLLQAWSALQGGTDLTTFAGASS